MENVHLDVNGNILFLYKIWFSLIRTCVESFHCLRLSLGPSLIVIVQLLPSGLTTRVKARVMTYYPRSPHHNTPQRSECNEQKVCNKQNSKHEKQTDVILVKPTNPPCSKWSSSQAHLLEKHMLVFFFWDSGQLEVKLSTNARLHTTNLKLHLVNVNLTKWNKVVEEEAEDTLSKQHILTVFRSPTTCGPFQPFAQGFISNG